MKYTWDESGNLVQREDVLASENETFVYDFLDRLLSVSGAYSDNYTYSEIGNIVSANGTSYTYGSQPHAVTSVGSDNYTYDANGNMLTRPGQSITWDVENRPILIITASGNSSFVYDGDGMRVKKTESGEQILYVNKYYEKNLTTGNITTYYYLGGRRVAMRKGTDTQFIHQDHISSTAVMTSDNGTQVGSMKYYPYGDCRNSTGDLGTDKLFTGQRLDDTGLYYYNARYYDAGIGRFISPDTFVQWSSGVDVVSNPLTVNNLPTGLGNLNAPQGNYPSVTLQTPVNPQNLNRYSYVLNNPLRYNDPYGWWTLSPLLSINISGGIGYGFAFNANIVFDNQGGIAFIWQFSHGPYVGISASAGPQFQYTSAEYVEELEGPCTERGLSSAVPNVAVARAGFSVGFEGIVPEDYSYRGVNINPGLGGGLGPVEMHSFEGHTHVKILRSGKNPSDYEDSNDSVEFKEWGTTSSGITVISMYNPSTYDPWEWF
jgi:RHS repeat-associated protein